MNVTEDDLRTYIALFHSTLESSAKEFLSEDDRKNLLHLSLTPARIIGYVSTQFGVAIEYEPATSTQIEIRRGSARVEDLFVQAPSAIRRTGPVFGIGGCDTGFYGCTLSGSFPFRLTEREASVTFGDVVFEAGRWKRMVHFAEVFGDRARELWTPEKAVSRAKDEVLVALVEISRAQVKDIPISEYIDKFKKKTVLVLGAYDNTGLERLESISRILGQLGYDPILIRDIPDHPFSDLRQKVITIGAISRFVVVDDSAKSGHLVEVELCDQNKWVTILLRAGGHVGSWMTAGRSHLSSVMLEQAYDPSLLEETIARTSEWAEQKLQDLQVKFDSTYPWRKKGS